MQDFWITRSASWKPSFFTWQLWGLDALPLKTHKKLLVIVPRLNCSIKLLSESDILNCDTATVCDLLKFPDPQISTMLSRSARAETRQSRKEDIKRVMHSVDKVIFKDKKFNRSSEHIILWQVRHWEKRWIQIPDTTMKQFKWMPVSQLIKTKTKSEPKQRRLFTDDGDNSRASLGMDEDSNMSNISTASDSMDGLTQLTAKSEEKV